MLWVIDALSILLVVVFGLITSFEDIKFNKIRNKWVLLAIISGFFLLALRFIVILLKGSSINPRYFTEFFLNLFITFVVGIFMWEMKLWSPADAKLFLGYAALIPMSIYRFGYINHFPSFVIIINAFTPLFFFYFFHILAKTGYKEKVEALKHTLKLKSFVELLLFIFGFSWVIHLVLDFFKISGYPFTTLIILFFVMLFFDYLKWDKLRVSLLLSILRLIFDYNNLLKLGFYKGFLLLVFILLLINFILKLALNVITKSISVSKLKPGMMIVGYEKRELTKKDIAKIKSSKKKSVEVLETLPFAPILFLGALLTIICQGNLLIVIRLLIERFI